MGRSPENLRSPNLEKALTFLDDKRVPATSNAVERGDRRRHKMRQSVYCVRTQLVLAGRLTLALGSGDRFGGHSSFFLNTLYPLSPP